MISAAPPHFGSAYSPHARYRSDDLYAKAVEPALKNFVESKMGKKLEGLLAIL